MLSHFSHVQLFATPWTIAHQAPLSMELLQARILEWVAMPSSIGFCTKGSYFLTVPSPQSISCEPIQRNTCSVRFPYTGTGIPLERQQVMRNTQRTIPLVHTQRFIWLGSMRTHLRQAIQAPVPTEAWPFSLLFNAFLPVSFSCLKQQEFVLLTKNPN